MTLDCSMDEDTVQTMDEDDFLSSGSDEGLPQKKKNISESTCKETTDFFQT